MNLREYWIACLDASAAKLPCPDYVNDDVETAKDLIEGALFRLSHTLKACLAEARREGSADRIRKIRLEEAAGTYTKSQVLLLLHNQNYRCAYARVGHKPIGCRGRIGFKTCHRDHVVPLAKGGANWISNIQLTCATCNRHKHAKDPIAFAQELGLLL